MKINPIIAILAVFLFTGCAMLAMSPAKTGQVLNTEIYSIRNSMGAVYLLNTGNGYVMFDAGNNIKNLEASFKKAEINPNDVKWIFLTHSDSDHIAGLPLFQNAIIYMNEDEFQLINGTTNRNRSGGNALPAGININAIVRLRNGQELIFGETHIECIKAPGHTPGSMLYLVNGQYLFVGDAFGIIRGRRIVHPFTMDRELAERTIEQLKPKIDNSSIILTSHYGFIKN